MTVKRFDSEALALALDERRSARGITWRRVAHEAGMSPSTLSRIACGDQITVRNLVALLGWLDQTDLAPYLVEAP